MLVHIILYVAVKENTSFSINTVLRMEEKTNFFYNDTSKCELTRIKRNVNKDS
jgi:hypothetical protein